MKQILVFSIFVALLFLSGCGDPARPVQINTNAAANQQNERPQSVLAHSSESNIEPPTNLSANSGQKSKWTQSGNPIDVSQYNAEIKKAEGTLVERSGTGLKSKQGEAQEAMLLKEAKLNLADALFKRAFALTEARQYASALGDYRRVLKYDPSNEDAKKWIDQIIMIYNSINKEYPKEGEEPPPLPYKAEK